MRQDIALQDAWHPLSPRPRRTALEKIPKNARKVPSLPRRIQQSRSGRPRRFAGGIRGMAQIESSGKQPSAIRLPPSPFQAQAEANVGQQAAAQGNWKYSEMILWAMLPGLGMSGRFSRENQPSSDSSSPSGRASPEAYSAEKPSMRLLGKGHGWLAR